MATVKVIIDGVDYYGSSGDADNLSAAILNLRDVLRDHDAPVSEQLRDLLDTVHAKAMGTALKKAVCEHKRWRAFDVCPAAYFCMDCHAVIDPPKGS